MASRTTLTSAYKNGEFTPIQLQSFPRDVAAGQVYSFGGRSAVALEDSRAGRCASFGFGGEWQFARGDVPGADASGCPVYDDGAGALSGGAGEGPAAGIVTSEDSEAVTILLY